MVDTVKKAKTDTIVEVEYNDEKFFNMFFNVG